MDLFEEYRKLTTIVWSILRDRVIAASSKAVLIRPDDSPLVMLLKAGMVIRKRGQFKTLIHIINLTYLRFLSSIKSEGEFLASRPVEQVNFFQYKKNE